MINTNVHCTRPHDRPMAPGRSRPLISRSTSSRTALGRTIAPLVRPLEASSLDEHHRHSRTGRTIGPRAPGYSTLSGHQPDRHARTGPPDRPTRTWPLEARRSLAQAAGASPLPPRALCHYMRAASRARSFLCSPPPPCPLSPVALTFGAYARVRPCGSGAWARARHAVCHVPPRQTPGAHVRDRGSQET